MVLRVERFIGAQEGGERQVHVTGTGWEPMSVCPFEEALQAREM